ncbi:peroxidasin-like protein [Platysternon megacephalum]|uniref:Peroxidasin-like protein n=1 Tax=Platysternon megacephalum TaxID=55544 RepID=A0A4D9ELS1_9SAUR|nr:peroxidasin-like protein [Platysternon megacephalum]
MPLSNYTELRNTLSGTLASRTLEAPCQTIHKRERTSITNWMFIANSKGARDWWIYAKWRWLFLCSPPFSLIPAHKGLMFAQQVTSCNMVSQILSISRILETARNSGRTGKSLCSV